MNPTILIVDDDTSVRETCRDILEAILTETCEYHEAEDGKKGLELLKNQCYTLVLTDTDMPHMSGPEMIQNAQQKHQYSGQMIIMTAHPTQERYMQAMELTGNPLLEKPFGVKDLLEAVNIALSKVNAYQPSQ